MTLSFDSVGSGPTAVLVNGASPPAWGELPRRLATTHRVVTYGRRGFPPNEHLPLASSLRQHADDLAEILDEVGPSTIVGWSSGGVVALDLVLRRPELAPRTVLIEAPLHARHHPRPGVGWAVVGARLKGRKDPEKGARHFLAWALGRTDGRPNDLTRLDPDGVRAAAPAIVHELSHATGEREIARRDLPRLAADTTWLVGTASVPDNRRLAASAARRSPRIEIREVSGSGHVMALDAPEVVTAAVTARAA